IGRARLGLDYDFVAAHAYARQSKWRRFLHMAYRLAAEVVPPLSGYEKRRRSSAEAVGSESRAISRR
ncbi:MAG: hypothetical protein ACJ75Z_10780, partial [Solirubrobacterales bacterium]